MGFGEGVEVLEDVIEVRVVAGLRSLEGVETLGEKYGFVVCLGVYMFGFELLDVFGVVV